MKKGRKTKQEREKEIDLFIKQIQYYNWDFCFLNVNYVNKQLEKFNKWGYCLGAGIMHKIDHLKDNAEKTKEDFIKIQKRTKKAGL